MSKTDRRARKRENRLQSQFQQLAAANRRRRRSGFIRAAFVVVAVMAVIALLLTLGRKSSKSKKKTTAPKITCTTKKPPRGSSVTTYKKPPPMTIDTTKAYTATMTTNCGTIVIALDSKEAPKTVNAFVFLARAHFYDGLTFHRVVPNFVVQGGDPTGTGRGGPGFVLPTEPPKNGYKAGSVAMANLSTPDSTGSQFFMTWSATGAHGLGGPPYTYSILGQITKGLPVVKQMGSYAPASGDGPPTHPLYIDKVTISES